MADYSGVDLWTCDMAGCSQRVTYKGQAFCPDHTASKPPQPELKSQKIFQVRNGYLYCLRCDTCENLESLSDWLRHATIHHRFFHTEPEPHHTCSPHCYEHFYEGDV